MYCCMKDLNISCTMIDDSAVGYIMERVDMAMVGAECVVECGGIVNKVIESFFNYYFFFFFVAIEMYVNFFNFSFVKKLRYNILTQRIYFNLKIFYACNSKRFCRLVHIKKDI